MYKKIFWIKLKTDLMSMKSSSLGPWSIRRVL